MRMTPVLRLDDARYGYHGAVAVHASLVVEAGEVVAVLGPNGSGKSTLIKGALGLVDSHGGRTEWFGRPLDELRERWRVGYVPQRQLGPSTVPVTVEELVRSGRVPRTGVVGWHRAADRRAVSEAIATVGLTDRRRATLSTLSGGQQRRAIVARGLAGDAEVLVLDEPFAGVDHENQHAIAATFATLAARSVTLIVVLHELGPLAELVTRVVSLASGRVVYDGAAAQTPPGVFAPHGDHDPHGGEPDAAPRIGLFPR